jgi:hypothetical protein
MHESFRAFAEGLIDYAGMFPPAELPLRDALAGYVRYRREPDAWMLGRFVCPAQRLGEVDPPVRVSALGRGGAGGAESYAAALEADVAEIVRFGERAGSPDLADTIEIRLPADVEPALVPGFRVFFEAPSAGRVGDTIDAIARARSAGGGSARVSGRALAAGGSGGIGFKLRCGGVTAESIPPCEQIASAIARCRRAGVAMKATAGLHHPIRSFRREVGTRMHGFLNVFGAALLAHAHGLDEGGILPILEDEDPADFRFTAEAFSWRDLRIETGRIRDLRRTVVASFGSCSFDEPRNDLRALGLPGDAIPGPAPGAGEGACWTPQETRACARSSPPIRRGTSRSRTSPTASSGRAPAVRPGSVSRSAGWSSTWRPSRGAASSAAPDPAAPASSAKAR